MCNATDDDGDFIPVQWSTDGLHNITWNARRRPLDDWTVSSRGRRLSIGWHELGMIRLYHKSSNLVTLFASDCYLGV